MDIIKALILGIVQGITEFLPISSSGHLVIMQHYLNFPLPPLLFDILLHLGTLGAVVIVFKKEIVSLLKSSIKYFIYRKSSENSWLLNMIIVATLPTAILGVLFKSYVESLFTSIKGVGIALLITAFLLFIAENLGGRREKDRISLLNALLIGTMQGISIIPGISRSGATISIGIIQNIKRELIAKFSFILSIPAILGAIIMELSCGCNVNSLLINWNIYLLGSLMATISGVVALKSLLWILRKGSLNIFSIYCALLGSFLIWKNI